MNKRIAGILIVGLFIGTVVPTSFITTVKADFDRGLIAYWNFDEGSGTIVHDSSGNGYDGTNVGGNWVSGNIGYGLEITGTDRVQSIPSSYDDSITNALTIATWVKWYGPNEYGARSIIFDGRYSSGNGIHFNILNTGKIHFVIHEPPSPIIGLSSVPSNGVWTHVAAVFDDATNIYKVFINGQPDGTLTTTTTYTNSDAQPFIGNNHWGSGDEWAPLNGVIDDLRIYNKALSNLDIQNLYNQGSTNHPPNKPSKPSGPESGLIEISYTFSTSATDLDNDKIRYGWDWDGNLVVDEWSELISSGSTDTRQHLWNSAGTYVVRVKSEDEHGAQSGWSQALGVVIENEPLIVDAEGPYEGNIMEDIEFDSTVTGGILPYEYLWDYGDGNTSSGDPHPTHNYGNAGNYTVTLTVTDSEDDTTSDTTWTYINAPPKTPIIDGPQHGKEGLIYIYTATTTDPDDDQIFYIWNFSDSSELIETLIPLDSGEICKLNHTFTEKGDYTLRVKARDIYDAESEWSEPLEISIPKTKIYNLLQYLLRLLERFPFFEKILKQILI